jgi:ADP-heptose:LPS heptosyltransferase
VRGRAPVPGKIALHAGSKGGIWAAKRWPGFAQLAGRLIGEGYEAVSVGTTDEYVPGTTDRTGLSIARMAEELSTCEVLVTNDSGVMNVANALGVPIVAIFAPTNPVTRGPLHARTRILTPATDCTPCEASTRYKSRFTDGKCQCIALVGVDEVMGALQSLAADTSVAVAAE